MPLHDHSQVIPGNWITYDCQPTGFSGTPTQRASKYIQLGNIVILWIDVNGTSNATTFTIQLPVAPQLATSDGLVFGGFYIVNNGGAVTTPGIAQCTSGTTLNIYRDHTFATWTASNAKQAAFTQVYAT